MTISLSRRSALATFLTSVPIFATTACASDPFPAAIRRAQAADAADREAGRFAREILTAGLPLPAGWGAYRAELRQARTAARFELHTLTPDTPAAAAVLVAYYRDRADASGEPDLAHHAARRRLRKVFRRPGSVAVPSILRERPREHRPDPPHRDAGCPRSRCGDANHGAEQQHHDQPQHSV